MKYLLPLLFLVGCESFPEKKEEAHLMEQIPLGETWVDDMIDDSIKVGPVDDLPRYTTVEMNVSFFTNRRYMIYIDVVGG
jgi:hypothetical protein